jgi:P4 family phage/plasmid primase-like protien
MNSAIYNVLQPLQVDGGEFNFVSQLSQHKGKYMIPRDEIDKFFKFYCDCLFKFKHEFITGLAEHPSEYMPILCDIDLKWTYIEGADLSKHFYTHDHVHQIVNMFLEVLKQSLKYYDEKDLYCFVLEKTHPYSNGPEIKNGFHLHFPFIYLSRADQDVHINPKVAAMMDKQRVFSDINIDNSASALDLKITSKYWLMYGSRKNAKLEPYVVTKIYDHEGNLVPLKNVLRDHPLKNSEDEIIKIEKPHEYYLPYVLSVRFQDRRLGELHGDIETILKQTLPKAINIKHTISSSATIPETIEQARSLLTFVDPARSDNYNDWMNVGWILFNISDGCEEGLNLWLQFSQQTTTGKFSETRCLYEWNRMKRKNITLGSLHHLAKKDNPEAYHNYTAQLRKSHLENSLLGGHSDMAKYLKDEFGDMYMCADIEKDIWFEFKEHRWTKIQRGYSLRDKIEHVLVKRYQEENRKSYREIEQEEDETVEEKDESDDTKKLKDRAQCIKRILGQLKNSGFKDSIMKECKHMFYDPKFLDQLDSNPYLLGFTNGVLDLKALEFRAGKCDDYISMSCNYEFTEYRQTDEEIVEVQRFFKTIFPDKELRNYFLEWCSMLLVGGNEAKTFMVAQGEGDNGKSVAIDFLEYALGDYAVKLPTSLLIGKRTQSSQATPELARCKGARLATLQEPEGSDTINSGILKELSGNDKIFVRGLFEAGKEIRPMLKLIFICNKLPKLTADDQATWNRVRRLVFESKFPANPVDVPKTVKEQIAKKIFPRDPRMSEKIEQWKPALMYLLFLYYRKIVASGNKYIREPQKVKDATTDYRQDNDYYLQFITENLVKDPLGNIQIKEAYEMFRNWFTTSQGGKPPTSKDFKTEMSRKGRLGDASGMRWNKWRFRDIADDEAVQEATVEQFQQDDFTEVFDDGINIAPDTVDELDDDDEYFGLNKKSAEINIDLE